MRSVWHITRERSRYFAIPMLWDEAMHDYRPNFVQTKRGGWRRIEIWALTVDGARAFVPAGLVRSRYETAAESVQGVCEVGDVLDEWWREPPVSGAQPRTTMTSMRVKTLEGRP